MGANISYGRALNECIDDNWRAAAPPVPPPARTAYALQTNCSSFYLPRRDRNRESTLSAPEIDAGSPACVSEHASEWLRWAEASRPQLTTRVRCPDLVEVRLL